MTQTSGAAQAEHVFFTWSAQNRAHPLPISGGEGAFFTTPDGERVLDLTSMVFNANLGHGHARMMAALARGKRLRGTALDPFGRTKLRRLERSLIGEYRSTLDRLAADLSADSIDEATAVARAAMDVRGYEDLKLERAEVFRSVLRHATAR